MDLEFQLLGPLAINGDRVRRCPPKPRALLAMVLLDGDCCVPLDRIVYELWGEQPPRSAAANVRSYATAVRRAVDQHGRLVACATGYTLAVSPGRLDVYRFRGIAAQAKVARAGADLNAAAALYTTADRVWRGAALEDVPVGPVLGPRRMALEEERLCLVEDHFDVLLALGRHEDALPGLRARVARHPLRERLVGQLMLALYRAGHTADALLAFRALRRTLAGELGVEPGAALQLLHQRTLAADAALDLTPRRVEAGAAVPVSRLPTRPIPAHLPPSVPDFAGRTATLRQLDTLVDGDGVVIVSLTGPPGVGKTALAVRWGHRDAHRFPDGQLYADLRGSQPTGPTDPLDILTRWLHSLGVAPGQVPGELDEATALYRSLLANRRVFVLLDDAAGEAQVRPLLPSTTGCLVVVTSRQRLLGLVVRDGARHVPVEPLTPDEAVGLVTRIIGPGCKAADRHAAAELARSGGTPLALRTAVAALIFGEGPGQPVPPAGRGDDQ